MTYAVDYHSPFIIWTKPITVPGVKPGMYSVTSIGDVINNYTGKVLSQAISYARGGYRSVGLQMEDGSRKIFSIHFLVAHEFIPKTDEDIALGRDVVHHKSMIKDDNYKDNLQWLTDEENINDANIRYMEDNVPPNCSELKEQSSENLESSAWGNTPSRGEANGMAKLTEETVHKICQLFDKGYKVMQVIDELGLEKTDNMYYNLNHIKNGHRWKHVSSQYNFMKNKNK